MDKILALILSFITSFSAFFSALPRNPADFILGLITGIPSDEMSINDSFLETVDFSRLIPAKEEDAFYKNLIIMFFEPGSSVAVKRDVFRDNGLRLLGWAGISGMFIVYSPFEDYEGISLRCREMEEKYPAVKLASPVPYVEPLPDTTPDDPFEGRYRWGDEGIKNSGSWYVDAAHIREAWNYSDYFTPIKVGVVDTGFDTAHEDLAGKISFPGSSSEKRNVPSSHGTFVSGMIAAQHNNGRGVAGINPGSSLICVDWKPEENQNWNTALHIFFGFCRLVKSGAKVINLSLGTSRSVDEADKNSLRDMDLYAAIYSAMMSVMLGRGYDFIAVQSAGNGNKEHKGVDAVYNAHFASFREDNIISLSPGIRKQDLLDRVLIVGAASLRPSDGRYHLAAFSNYGDSVNIAAPGVNVYGLSTGDKKYALMTGTSAAAPVVAGTASLVWCVNPSLTGAQVKKIVTENAGETVYPYSGSGKEYKLVNAKKAVEAALRTKYEMYSVTGEIDTGEFETPADLITVESGGKAENITVLSGKIDLIYENGDGKIIINGDYGDNEFEKTAFSVSGKDVDLGTISFLPGQAEDAPPAESGMKTGG